MKIRQPVLCFIAFFLALALIGCGSKNLATTTATPQTFVSNTQTITASPQPGNTATPTLDLTAYDLTHPAPAPTGTPFVDADGNVTWHPEQVLISWSEYGNDGNDYHAEPFTLYWDGELFLHGNVDENDIPYALQLSPTEVCKLLNTVNASGFFEETDNYRFHFGGLGGDTIAINAWKTRRSSVEMLSSAIVGASYYATLFCRDCPVPSEGTIIQPGLANIYSLLKTYRPKNLPKAPAKEVLVQVNETEREINSEWRLKSMPMEQFLQLMRECYKDGTCSEGKIFRGDFAQEIMEKIGNAEVFEDKEFFGSFSISYLPKAPDVPPDATLTCNTKVASYPILPLNKDNKFWYYAPGGQWGAERIEGENKIRVVNTSGYEKFYSYDAAFFRQSSIQFYPRYWSADDQFFYVNILPGDYKPNVSLENSIGLQQIDVKNEKIKYLFLGTKGETFAYQFSTDGKNVAYVRQGDHPIKLVVANTVSGEEHAVSLTRPDGTPYTSAGTLLWAYDSIFLAASYAENGTEKTDILATNPNNLALRVLYTANTLMKLREYSSAYICPIQAGGDDNCPINLNMETGEVK